MAAPTSGGAVAALVLGVVALLGCWIPFLGLGSLVIGVVGVVLGVLALRAARAGRAGGTGLAVAGLVLSGVSILVALLVSALVVVGIATS